MNINSFDGLLCKIGMHKWKKIEIHLIDAANDEVPYIGACECERPECGKIKVKCNNTIKNGNEWEDFHNAWLDAPMIHMYKNEVAEKRID